MPKRKKKSNKLSIKDWEKVARRMGDYFPTHAAELYRLRIYELDLLCCLDADQAWKVVCKYQQEMKKRFNNKEGGSHAKKKNQK